MKKILLTLLLAGTAAAGVMAQQRPQYSQYMMNNYLLNPAVTGIEDFADARFGMRRQWVGLEGAPVSYYASIHTSIAKKDRIVQTPFALFKRGGGGKARRNFQGPTKSTSKFHTVNPHHGAGAIVEVDRTGPLSTTAFHASYAYHQPLSQSLRLSIGLAGGFVNYSLNRQRLHLVNEQDDAVSGKGSNNFDLTAGAWLYAENFYVGLSGGQLLRNQLDFTGGGFNNGGRLQAHFFGTAGAKLNVSDQFAFVPSIMVKMASPSPVAVDVNIRGVYAQTVWGGLSYRQNDAVALMAGGNITPRLSVGYSYDFTTSGLNRVSAGSHELVLGLKVGNNLMPQNWLPWW